MCLTPTNAATIHHHTDPTGTTGSSARGYTSTTPPRRAPHPRRPVAAPPGPTAPHGHDIHRHHGVIVLTDQYGSTWTDPATIVIPTAGPDPLHVHTSTTANGGTR